MLDLILAVAHHILVFGLFGVLFAEFILVRPGMDAARPVRAQRRANRVGAPLPLAQITLFPLLLVFAAAMARGYGQFA